MRYGAAAIIAVRSLVPALGAQSECAPRRSGARQTPFLLHRSNTSTSVDPDVLLLAKGYLACFMDTTAEGLTFASFSANDPESEA
jgi:hypothetical protein